MSQMTKEKASQPREEHTSLPPSLSREMVLDFTTFNQKLKNNKAASQSKSVSPLPITPHYRWEIIEHISDNKTGWEGALLHTRVNDTDYYAAYHQGANDVEDIKAVRDIYCGEVPTQMMAAKSYMHRWNNIIAERQQGKRSVIVDVGYSLGGVVCSLNNNGYRPCVVIDSPSPEKVYDKLGVSERNRHKNKLTILSPHPTYYNANGKHYGNILVAGERFWDYPKGKRVGMRHFSEMSKQSHKMHRISTALAGEREWNISHATELYAEKDSRPVTVFEAVHEFVEESKQHRSHHTFTEKTFARLVKRQFEKGPEAEVRFFAKIAKWMERSPMVERVITERLLGRKISQTPAQSWATRSLATQNPPIGRGL